jgi:MFS family permease
VSNLGYSASEAGYLFGVVGLIQLLMIAPAGYLSDKVGRKAAVVPAAPWPGSPSRLSPVVGPGRPVRVGGPARASRPGWRPAR